MNPTAVAGTRVQPRDLPLLQGLFDARVLSLQHIAAMYFGGRHEAAKKRVQKLKAARWISERPRLIGQPSILFITRRGMQLLHDHGLLASYPQLPWSALSRRAHVSELTVRHELDVATVRAALTTAITARPDCRLIRFTTWPRLYQFRARPSPTSRPRLVQPDGYMQLTQITADGPVDRHFFLEVDRSTESQPTLATRMACYRDYYRSGGFARFCGHDPCDYRRFPFRVLLILRTAERQNNTADMLLELVPKIRRQIWMTTFSALIRTPLAPVWMCPCDLACTATTPHAGSPLIPYDNGSQNLLASTLLPR